MRRSEKACKISEILEDLYPEPPIPLDHTDPYTLLVSVALSAQTTDKKVNQITPALFAEGGTPEDMAALHPDRILEMIRQVGLAATQQKIPWLLIAGDRDVEAGAVSVRLRSGEDLGAMSIEDFITYAQPIIESKTLDLQ